MTRAELVKRIHEIAEEDMEYTGGKPAFTDDWVPDRWFAERRMKGFLTRCENAHVSSTCLSTENRGLLCMECFCSPVWTFPEDSDGPLNERWDAVCCSRRDNDR